MALVTAEMDGRTAAASVISSEPTYFDIKTPYLEEGITTDYRARTDVLGVTIKVYASGGENNLHAHVHEDHSFIVLEGRARFYVGLEEAARVVGPYEGVMLPKGTYYRFESLGPENLVMLRVGAQPAGVGPTSRYPDGAAKSKEAEPPSHRVRIERPGPGFGDPRP
ncbi:MAG TPA: cupin domain-containing protein [Chloroflexota bacterium]|nr:cupin domain-containing protein [Chloroflexota bacterium]